MSLWRHVQSGPRHRQQETTLHEAYCPSISLRKRLTTKRSQTKAEHTLKGSFITPVFSWIVGILHPTLCATQLAGAGSCSQRRERECSQRSISLETTHYRTGSYLTVVHTLHCRSPTRQLCTRQHCSGKVHCGPAAAAVTVSQI